MSEANSWLLVYVTAPKGVRLKFLGPFLINADQLASLCHP